jgi:hypothetical protein
MKIPHQALAIAAIAAMSHVTYAGTSAKQAIATLRTAEGSNITKNIIGLTGRFGQDQPNEWEVLARRGDDFAMFIVDGKSVLSYSKVRPKAATKLATQLMKHDSSSAFRIADKAAKTASIAFDSLNYALKPRTDSSAPVWIVSLADTKGTTVGQIDIAADSGSVLRTNWDLEQLNRPAGKSGSTRGILADRRGTSTQTSSTADGVRQGLANVGKSIRNVFRKEEQQVSKTNQSQSPPTTKTKPTPTPN